MIGQPSLSHRGIGDNQPTFEQIRQENLTHGLLLAMKNCYVTLSRDSRAEKRHHRVLAEIVDCLNSKTGMAFPGRRRLAELTSDAQRPTGYSEATIAKTISELMAWGYIVTDRRAPEGGGRVMSHYTITKPSAEELQAEIAAWVEKQRAKAALDGREPPFKRAARVAAKAKKNGAQGADGEPALSVTDRDGERAGNVTPALSDRADEECVVRADGECAVPTVTSTPTSNRYTPQESAPTSPMPLEPEPPTDVGSALVELQFEKFWAAFPAGRKNGKGKARTEFKRVISGKHPVGRCTAERLIEAATAYAASRPNPKYVPLPTTWLSSGRWEDDVCQPRGGTQSQSARDKDREEWQRQLDAVAEMGRDND